MTQPKRQKCQQKIYTESDLRRELLDEIGLDMAEYVDERTV